MYAEFSEEFYQKVLKNKNPKDMTPEEFEMFSSVHESKTKKKKELAFLNKSPKAISATEEEIGSSHA